MKTNSEYKQDERNRKRGLGLIPKEIWVFNDDWIVIKNIINKFTNNRLTKLTSQNKVKAD